MLPSATNRRTSDGLPIRRGHPNENNIFLIFLYNFWWWFKSKKEFFSIHFFLCRCRSHWCKYCYSTNFFKWFFWLHRQYARIFWIDFMLCWLIEILVGFQFMTLLFSSFAEFHCIVIVWFNIFFCDSLNLFQLIIH